MEYSKMSEHIFTVDGLAEIRLSLRNGGCYGIIKEKYSYEQNERKTCDTDHTR